MSFRRRGGNVGRRFASGRRLGGLVLLDDLDGDSVKAVVVGELHEHGWLSVDPLDCGWGKFVVSQDEVDPPCDPHLGEISGLVGQSRGGWFGCHLVPSVNRCCAAWREIPSTRPMSAQLAPSDFATRTVTARYSSAYRRSKLATLTSVNTFLYSPVWASQTCCVIAGGCVRICQLYLDCEGLSICS
jgi:hypothetical protein